MVALVRQTFDAGRIVAAICHAGWMLCSAGVLEGKEATSFSAIKDDMVNAEHRWVDREVVQDGTLITSRTPDDLPVFMRHDYQYLLWNVGYPEARRASTSRG